MAQPETFSDASPDFNANTDITAVEADAAVLKSDSILEAATPTNLALLAEDQHLRDQIKVDLDDYEKQERQKAIDLATTVYGESGPASDLIESKSTLAGLGEQETSDETLP